MPDASSELKKVPFLKLVIPFIAGIISGLLLKISTSTSLFFLLFTVSTLILLSLFKIQKNFRFGYIWGVTLNIMIIAFGMCLTRINLEKLNQPEGLAKSENIIIEIIDIPILTDKGIKAPAVIKYFKFGNDWKKCSEKCNFYVAGKIEKKYSPGDLLYVDSKLKPIDFPVSPYQFDFKKYLHYKGVSFSIYTNEKHVKNIDLPKKQSISLISLQIRDYLLNTLSDAGLSKKNNAVLSALLLGYTGDLDPDVRNSYAIAGVMHILSVSGMHVGIVYLFMLYLLFFMEKNKYLKLLQTVLIIFSLWFYALITGFSPPVIRAATMFSFFAAGQAINRNANEFNTLAAAAFLILLINPLQIADLGFQLSFSALAGIFLFYKPLYNSWAPSSWILDKTWALTALSISAQLGTLPLSLFYFHQFPTYFIITNIIIVPLSGIIIYAGLALLILSFFPLAMTILAFLLNILLTALDFSVSSVEYLPLASITGIYLNLTETMSLAGLILIVANWLNSFNKKMVFAFLSLLLIFTTSISIRHISRINQKILIVHNSGNRPAMSIIHGSEWLLITDSSQKAKIEVASANMVSKYRISKIHYLNPALNLDTFLCHSKIHSLGNQNTLILFNNKNIVLLKNSIVLNENLPVDYLIDFSRKEKFHSEINLTPSYFISYKNSQTIASSDPNIKNEVMYYFVNEQGSFKADL